MQQFDFDVKHRTGKQIGNADPLSRAPAQVNALATMETGPPDIAEAQRRDPDLGPVMEHIVDKRLPENRAAARRVKRLARRCIVADGMLYHDSKEQGPSPRAPALSREMRAEVLTQLHDDPLGGHLSKTYGKVQRRFWWPNIVSEVKQWQDTCPGCQSKKTPRVHVARVLQPIVAQERWQVIEIGLVGPLPMTRSGKRCILVCSEYLTKWPETFAIRRADAHTVGDLLAKEVICRYGAPEKLLSDRGKVFLGGVVRHLCEVFVTEKTSTTPYHPHCDELTERFNHTLVEMLSMHVSAHQKDWDEMLQAVLLAYRSSVHSSTGCTLALLMMGCELRQPLDVALGLV